MLSTRSSDILSLFTTRVEMDCWYNINFPGSTPAHMFAKLPYLVTFLLAVWHVWQLSSACHLHESEIWGQAKNQRFSLSLSSPLHNPLLPFHSSLSLWPRRISRKPLGSGYYLQYNWLFLSCLKFAVYIFILTDLEIQFALSKFSTTYILKLI